MRSRVLNDTIPYPKKERKCTLPKINKNYIELFLDQTNKNKIEYRSVERVSKNNLIVDVRLPNGSDIGKFEIIFNFDKYNDIEIIIDTDDIFYNSVFYEEVIQTDRYKEAWQIIRNKYKPSEYIHKFIYFLLNAPTTIIELLKE